MIQLIISITEGKEPTGECSCATQMAVLNVKPATAMEQAAADSLSGWVSEIMSEWHKVMRDKGMVKAFTEIRHDP